MAYISRMYLNMDAILDVNGNIYKSKSRNFIQYSYNRSQKRMDCASLLVQLTLLAQLLVSRSTFDGKKLQGFHLKILCQVSFQSTRFVEEYGFEKYPRRIQFYFQS